MGTLYLNRTKFSGQDATGENIKVTYKGEERQLNSVLNELGLEYVSELPTEIVEKVVGIDHVISISKDYNTYADDVIGDYFHFDRTNKYILNDGVISVTSNGKNITYFTIGADSYVADNGDRFNFLNKYNFHVEYSETHTDFYVGDKQINKWVHLAGWEEVERYFIKKEEKGTAGGVATLDANGMIPISQMPTQSQIYAGEWDASTGNEPPTPARSGVYYNISLEGTINNVHYNVNDWIIWNGTTWNRQVQTSDVSSVDGRTGAVDLEDKYVQLNSLNSGTGELTMNALTANSKVTVGTDGIEIHKLSNGEKHISNVDKIFSDSIIPKGDSLTVGATAGKLTINGDSIDINSNNKTLALTVGSVTGLTNTNYTTIQGVDFRHWVDNNVKDGEIKYLRAYGCLNMPFNDSDYIVTIMRLSSSWITVNASDIRTSLRYTTNKYNGAWQEWKTVMMLDNVNYDLSSYDNSTTKFAKATYDSGTLYLTVV